MAPSPAKKSKRRAPRRAPAEAPQYILYTDGSFRPGNGGCGAWAAIALRNDKVTHEVTGYSWGTTISRMELTAVIEGISLFPEEAAILLYSDSMYCVNTINRWIRMWERAGWVNYEGHPVKNQDLMRKLAALLRRYHVIAHHVYGHKGNQYNERCDTLCQDLTRRMVSGDLKPLALAA
jgi:ribonuclease HI